MHPVPLPGPHLIVLPVEVKSTTVVEALAFNAPGGAALFSVTRPSGEPEREYSFSPDGGGIRPFHRVTFLLGPMTRASVRARVAAGQIDSNGFTLEGLTPTVEPLGDPQLLLAPDTDDPTVWVAGADVTRVVLVDAREVPLTSDQVECRPPAAAWLRSQLTSCRILQFGPLLPKGYRDRTVWAVIDGRSLTNSVTFP